MSVIQVGAVHVEDGSRLVVLQVRPSHHEPPTAQEYLRPALALQIGRELQRVAEELLKPIH